MHAFIDRVTPPLLILQLERARLEGKFHTAVTPDTHVMIPFFEGALAISWRCYVSKAVVEHYGEHITSAHYRSLLREPGGTWQHTDDNVPATVAEWSAECGALCYLFWLVPAQDAHQQLLESPGPVQGAALDH